MRLGVVQGRLSKPVDNHIQEFPFDDWEHEFKLIQELGLDHIEWLITKKAFENGVLELDAKKYSNKITSIGCDNLTNKNIGSKNFLDDQLDPICQFAIKNNIKAITIPLLEVSCIDNFVDKFVKNISYFGNKYPQIEFNFELESSYNIALDVCYACDNFYLTYDTGNITACGFDHEQYIISCLKFIKTVHLKDKTRNPIQNVEPLTGDTDFKLIFQTLKNIGYTDKFTLQTNRGYIGQEFETIKRHKKLFEDLYESI